MESIKTESERVENQKLHIKFMWNILNNLKDTPMVLKGGTCLMFAYGLDRFSEDLDFDSPLKLNLESKIMLASKNTVKVDSINLKKDTSTVTRYMIRYHDKNIHGILKIETSYRSPLSSEEIFIKDGVKFCSLHKMLDYKLTAAYDGENTRTRARDLYDICFLTKKYHNCFTKSEIERLKSFGKDIDKIYEQFESSFSTDQLLSHIDLEDLLIDFQDNISRLSDIQISPISQSHSPSGYHR